LNKIGIEGINSNSNFIFINFKQDTIKLFKELLYYGIIIRPCAPWGLEHCARVSIGTIKQNQLLIAALKKILKI